MQVIGDLIWVFGSAGDAAEAESQKVATSAVPELTDGSSFHFPWFVRDLPYDASVLLENVSPSEPEFLPSHPRCAALHDLMAAVRQKLPCNHSHGSATDMAASCFHDRLVPQGARHG